MVAGIDVIMYRPDDELKGLARLAVELGVDDLFTEGCVAADVLTALEARGEAGAQWLDAFGKARDPWFHVSSGDGFYHHHLSWNDDLTVPFTALPGYVAAARAGGIAPRPTAQLISRAGADRRRVPRPAGDRRREGRLRPDARPVPAGVPVRRGPQVLLRALVHHPVLPEGEGVRRAAARPRACSPRPTTCSTCTTPRSTRRSPTCRSPGRPARRRSAPGTSSRSSPSASG